jgi:TetR/AcrR family transcriptional regulator
MGQPSSSTRRDRILAAAEREFATQGFSGARVDRIAALAEVNKQLLFHYFGSKAGLYQAAVAAALDRAVIHSTPRVQPAERLRHLVGQLQRVTAESPALLALLADSQGEGDIAGPAEQAADAWHARAIETTRCILEDGQRSGHFRDDIDAAPIAELIVSASLGTIAKTRSRDSDVASRARDRIRDTLVRMVMDCCSWR